MIIRTLFSGLIFPKTNRGNFQPLPKTWVSPFKKSLYGHCLQQIFFSLGGLDDQQLELDDQQTLFKGQFLLQKQTKRKFSIFDKNHGLTPSKNLSMAAFQNHKSWPRRCLFSS